MTLIENLALKAFAGQIGDELVLAQVLICRDGASYELRHVEDRSARTDSLRLIKLNEARQLAQFTAAGEFRPLKSAPNLQGGWRLVAVDDAELELALNRLYPGAIADWWAAKAAVPPVTNYREYTDRQSGMYRITTMLTDAEAAKVIGLVCDKSRCLKRRLWTVTGLATDRQEGKSLISCLEPCAILMESARKAVRAGQRENPASY